MKPVSRGIDGIAVTFDEDHLVATAGLLLVATVVTRLGLEALVSALVRIPSKRGGFDAGSAGQPCGDANDAGTHALAAARVVRERAHQPASSLLRPDLTPSPAVDAALYHPVNGV